MNAHSQSERTAIFRAAIKKFIEARREAKKIPEGDPRYAYQAWVEKAAEDAQAIQFATHVARITHSSSQCDSFYAPPDTLPYCDVVARNAMGADFPEDASAKNASALYVIAFLNLRVDGKRLLDCVLANDPALREALAPSSAAGDEMMMRFSSVVSPPKSPRVDALIKQVFWLQGDDPAEDQDFIVIAPLACSSLMHKLYTSVQSANFSEESKEARKARREGRPSEHSCISYRDVIEWHVGGANPQNVSPLNSARRGVSYLLSSLPPKWAGRSVPDLRRRDSAIPAFIKHRRTYYIIKELAGFLKANPPPTVETRKQRAVFEDDLCQALAEFTESVRSYEKPGWTEAADCRLPMEEKAWLDPMACANASEAGRLGQWEDAVSARIANALSAALQQYGVLGLGDTEFAHWCRILLRESSWHIASLASGGMA